MNHGPLHLVRLSQLMERAKGNPVVRIGLIDGPVATSHPDLASARIDQLVGVSSGPCVRLDSAACRHGTFIAGMLVAKRGSTAPAICPGCTLVLRAIFTEGDPVSGMPTATPATLAMAIHDCMDADVHVINVSAAMTNSLSNDMLVQQALDRAARRRTIVVAAAGNYGTLGSSAITRHPWVIPVVGCDLQKCPLPYSNLGRSIGLSGLSAPGEGITSLSTDGQMMRFAGTSIATPFVTGAIALVWSEFPSISAVSVRAALLGSRATKATVVPPLLNAWTAYEALNNDNFERGGK